MTPRAARVLVVNDDGLLSGMLERVLTSEGYEVELAATAEAAKAAVDRARPDVILLDVVVAGKEGRDVLTELRLRRSDDVPVIVVSGRTTEAERVTGGRIGSDGYLVAPFSNGELTERVEAALRQRGRREASMVRRFGSLEIDLSSREVRLAGRMIEMTAKEFDLLAFLSASPRQVFSRGVLLERVWGSSAEWQDPATVTEHVRRLRVKLEDESGRPRWIVTLRGVGYRFEAEPDQT